MKFVAKYPFHGDSTQGQLSFPVGAVIVQSMDDQHAPRNGWMHGDFQGSVGWFPANLVEPIGGGGGFSAGSVPSSAPPLPEANMVPPTNTFSASAPPVAAAIAVPDSTPASASVSLPHKQFNENEIILQPASASVPLSPPVHKQLDENQIDQLTRQGYTRGRIVSFAADHAHRTLCISHCLLSRTRCIPQRFQQDFCQTVRQLLLLAWLVFQNTHESFACSNKKLIAFGL